MPFYLCNGERNFFQKKQFKMMLSRSEVPLSGIPGLNQSFILQNLLFNSMV